MSEENMEPKPLVIYHGGACYDGFCAAWVARKAIGEHCDFVPAMHGDAPPAVDGRSVFILDFCYPRDVLLQMAEVAKRVTVLDHHQTSEQALTGIKHPRLRAFFDNNRSGGRLTWNWFFPAQDAPWLVEYTEDRDLWRWKLPYSKELNAALRSRPLDFELWDRLEGERLEFLMLEGKGILRDQQQKIQQHVTHARDAIIGGYTVPCVNATVLLSEIGQELAKRGPFGVTYFITGGGVVVFQLRSHEGSPINVGEIAQKYGGGGHRHAAGFSLPMEQAREIIG